MRGFVRRAEVPRPEGAGPTIWSLAYANLIAISFFQSMGQMMMSTLVPLCTHDLGASAYEVGVVAGAFAVTALALRPFLGPAFDSFSKKRLILLALAVIVVATFLYSVATDVRMLVGARLLHGAGMACASPAALALVSDLLPSQKMSSGISVYGLAFAVAQSIGPAFGLGLLGLVGYEKTFRIAGLMMVLAFLMALFLKEPQGETRKPYRLELSRMFAKQALIPASMGALLALSFSCVGAFVVIYGQSRGVSGMGWYFAVYSLCLLATRPAFGMLSDKLGPNRVIPAGLLCFAASICLISRADTLQCFLAAALVGALGYGALHPLLQSLCMLCAPGDASGSASNTIFMGLDFGYLAGPVLGGAVAEVFLVRGLSAAQSYSCMYIASLIPVLCAWAVFSIGYGHVSQLMLKAADGGGTVRGVLIGFICGEQRRPFCCCLADIASGVKEIEEGV